MKICDIKVGMQVTSIYHAQTYEVTEIGKRKVTVKTTNNRLVLHNGKMIEQVFYYKTYPSYLVPSM